ncbi:MAG TPA: hypothetical protein VKT78_20265 [Fimbriimonadaceae bacterium]|nr:hypothetical protein [Fimbriimonadaceae bacterium]
MDSGARTYPVVLIAFNRPGMTRRVLDSIRPNKPPILMVCIDGPRDGRADDPERIEATAKLFDQIDWPCELTIKRQGKNLGCRHNPAFAIQWMLDTHGAGVIMEDDCVASPSFLPFCWELLTRYEHDARVGMISGIGLHLSLTQGASYGFSQYSYISAWATWKDRWDGLDLELKDWPTIKAQRLIENVFPDRRVQAFWTRVMERVYNGDPRTESAWDFQWSLRNFLQRRVCIVPSKNLICNVGSDEDATNSLVTDWFLNVKAEELDFPLTHPEYMVVDAEADREAERRRFSLRPLPVRAARRVAREVQAARIKRGAR